MRHFLSLFVVECGLVTVAMAVPPLGLSDDQQRRLDADEVILLDALPPGAGKFAQGGTAIAVVRASPEAVWRVLVDYPGHSRLYPRVVGVEVLEAREGHALIRYVVGIGPFSFRFDMDKYLDRARGRIEWRLADGHSNTLFRENSGYWQVDAAEGASLVTYAIAVRTILPAFLTRRSERESLVDTINAVRRLVAERSAASAAILAHPTLSSGRTRQRGSCLREPAGHPELVEHGRRALEVDRAVYLGVEEPEAEMAARHERPHSQLLCQGEGLAGISRQPGHDSLARPAPGPLRALGAPALPGRACRSGARVRVPRERAVARRTSSSAARATS